MSGLTRSEATTGGLSPTGSDPVVLGQLRADELDTAEPAVEHIADDASVDSWRIEVAARLERYRTKRKPRAPRYPSLLLPFDAPDSWSRSVPASEVMKAGSTAGEQEFSADSLDRRSAQGTEEPVESHLTEQEIEQRYPQYTDSPAKVIEFPRSAAIPVVHASELAEPVFDFDRPRIVEAPEVVPPPPALGGMLIEAIQRESTDRRVESVLATPSASIARRFAAALIDGLVVSASLAAFAAVVFRLTAILGPVALLAGTAAMVAVLLWAAYEFLFVVYTGSTPGLRIARLQLVNFDGSPLNRRWRRWRVLAEFLSVVSAGLGCVWCFLDQEGLCWHDRITRTCVATIPVNKASVFRRPFWKRKTPAMEVTGAVLEQRPN